jgi:hypothetical protein
VKITPVDLTVIRTPDRPVRSLVAIPTALLLLLLLLVVVVVVVVVVVLVFNNFILRALLSHKATVVMTQLPCRYTKNSVSGEKILYV